MKRKRSGSPAFKESFWTKQQEEVGQSEAMTVQGAVNKSILLFAILLLTAIFTFRATTTPTYTWLIVGLVGGLITALITIFSPQKAPVTAPLYAIFEGIFVGAISLLYGLAYSGIVFQAICLTMGILFTMLFLYKSGIIKVTQRFRTGVIAAMGGIALLYITSMILGFFGITMPLLHESSMAGIGINILIVGVAAFMLLLDFDSIEEGAEMKAPKYVEWYGAFSLILTLVWLYIQILRLLSLISGND